MAKQVSSSIRTVIERINWKLAAKGQILMATRHMTRQLQTEELGRDNSNVRCYSNSGQTQARSDCPLCANSGHGAIHSITSSARASNVGGTVRPSALAVLRLITSTYLVGACTGRAPGFSPFRMRST
jgi:hypothetical protein